MCKLHSIFLFAASTIVLSTGCSGRTEIVRTERTIPVKTLTVSGSTTAAERNYIGAAEESNAISLSFPLMGTVERIAVSKGQRVGKGELLAVLNSETTQNSHDVAKATLMRAQDAYDRIKPLHEKGSVTDIQFVEVETGLKQAIAMEAIALKNLEDTKLYAPFAGIIAQRFIEAGVNVMPGVMVFRLVSIDEVDVNVPIPENEINDIRMGQPAIITVAALGNKQFNGTVHQKSVEANIVSRTYDVKLRVKNPQSELMHGMVCRVIIARKDAKPQIVIPNKSVQTAPDGKRFVWLSVGNVATRRFITTGALTDLGVTVESGLSEGDKLITEGYNKVSEGMMVMY